jgi:hypothetical protein
MHLCPTTSCTRPDTEVIGDSEGGFGLVMASVGQMHTFQLLFSMNDVRFNLKHRIKAPVSLLMLMSM